MYSFYRESKIDFEPFQKKKKVLNGKMEQIVTNITERKYVIGDSDIQDVLGRWEREKERFSVSQSKEFIEDGEEKAIICE